VTEPGVCFAFRSRQALPLPPKLASLAHAAAERVAAKLPLQWRNDLYRNPERSLHIPVYYFGRPEQATLLTPTELMLEHNTITTAFQTVHHPFELHPVGASSNHLRNKLSLPSSPSAGQDEDRPGYSTSHQVFSPLTATRDVLQGWASRGRARWCCCSTM
jgi:hypothetical protein